PCGDLYALFLERGLHLSHPNGQLGFIVPLSSFSVPTFSPLQQLYCGSTSALHVSNWSGDAHPSKLFEGVDKRLEIVLAKRHMAQSSASVNTTRYAKWYSNERPHLFSILPVYQAVKRPGGLPSTLPKVGSDLESGILEKLSTCVKTVGLVLGDGTNERIYYTRKVSFFLQFLDFIPEVRDSAGRLRPPSELKVLTVFNEAARNLCLAALSSSLFYWYN